MKIQNIIIVLIIVVCIVGLVLWKASSPDAPLDQTPNGTEEQKPAFDQSVSDNLITISYSSSRFGLAVNQSQILTNSYIPPCDPDFDYCLYYNGTDYAGTNFDSAGLRIKKRADISNERLCLDTPPEGYDASSKPTREKSGDDYSTSIFENIGDAGAGHFATGSLYRLYVRDTSACYELQARVGQTQFANYPEGSIIEFTSDDADYLQSQLMDIAEQISLPSGEKGLFPL